MKLKKMPTKEVLEAYLDYSRGDVNVFYSSKYQEILTQEEYLRREHEDKQSDK